MPSSVHKIAAQIIDREGGFVHDPDDPGGATNYGVTIHTLRRLGLDLDGDGHVGVGDVKSLSRAQAIDIFIKHYFESPGLGKLPAELQASVFDMQVNAGAAAIKILQRLLCDMGMAVKIDGKCGPITAGTADTAFQIAPHHLCDAYAIARRNYYYALADARPKSRKYARRRGGGKGGWILRAEKFMAPKYHLTDAQHQERTQKWGS